MYPVHRFTHNWLIKELVNRQVQMRLPRLTGAVVDLGCGVRPFAPDIEAHCDSYLGVDWVNTLHGLRADVVADLNHRLPFEDHTFDNVVSFEVIEHLAEPDTMLAEAWRILRPGGSITLSAPFQWWLHEAPWDYQRFTRHGFDYHLRKAGFVDIKIAPTSGFWSMWILKLNYQTVRLIRGPKILRFAIRACLVPFWFVGQVTARALDRHWHAEEETAGYFVTACKL